MLSILAPAKINLVLEVLGKRVDGYHEIRSLMQTVSLCDALSFELADDISLECSEPSLQNEDNLIFRAAALLKQACDCNKGAKIKLEKRIPMDSGLGGGSSDAAVTLAALNELWGLKLRLSELVAIGAKLGSDVPFFFHRGTAMVEGRGEKVIPLQQLLPNWFVLMIPSVTRPPQKTRELYSRINQSHYTDGSRVYSGLETLSRGGQLPPALLYNVFDEVAYKAFPGLEDYRRRFEKVGAVNIHVAGSGPALFVLAAGEARADEWCRKLREQGLEAYSVATFEAQVA
jgi:4-diphosphocytidyl-2-C-methyl-D-erythritol kinase